jgi:hypothetical protein
MALVRAVTFNGVTQQRVDELENEVQQDPPEGLNPSEILVLHDADSQEALVLVFFENEQDYARGDAVLDAMPADDTPGQRTGVRKYNVAVRMTP